VARHTRLCVTAALSLLVLTACGARQGAGSQPTPTDRLTTSSETTSGTPSSPPSSPSSAPSSPAGGESSPPNQDNPCVATALSGTVEAMDAAAGNRFVTLVVKNKSQQTCTIWGYGSLELVDIAKEGVPTNVERTLDPAPSLVTLAPGKEAGKILHWTVLPTGDEPAAGPCQPAATAVNVMPPDGTAPLLVTYQFGSVCDHGKLDTSAYFAR
jgi:uncharacterized protein DUF4232